jgi:HK97 family phage major capsid protein
MEKIADILQARYELAKRAQTIAKKAADEKRELSDSERTDFDGLLDKVDKMKEEVDRRTGVKHVTDKDIDRIMADMEKPIGRRIVEDVGVREAAGTSGHTCRTRDGREYRIWHPGERISSYQGTRGESEARLLPVLRGAVTGIMDDLTQEERGLAMGSLVGGGVLVPDNWSRDIVQAARNTLTAGQVASIVELPGGNLTLPGVSGIPTASWIGEGGTFAESNSTFFACKLVAHKVGCYSKVSIELADNGNGIESQIENDLTAGVNLAVDQAFYEGTGVNRPLGLKNHPNVNSTDAASGAITLDNYFQNAYWLLMSKNCPEKVFMVAHSKWHAFLDNIKLAGAGLLYAFSTGNGTTPNAAKNITPLMSNALTSATGDILDIYTLPRYATVIGYAPGGTRIEVFRGSDTAITQGQVFIRIYLMMDSGVLAPDFVHVYKNVDAT